MSAQPHRTVRAPRHARTRYDDLSPKQVDSTLGARMRQLLGRLDAAGRLPWEGWHPPTRQALLDRSLATRDGDELVITERGHRVLAAGGRR